MFVLYYLNNYYCGDAEFEIIAASPNKEKLEEKTAYLIEGSQIDKKTVDEYQKEKTRRYEGYKKTIRDFLNRNFDALKIYLPAGYKDICTPEELKEMEKMDRQATIDWVVDVHPHVFYKSASSKVDQGFLDRVFDFTKLREYLPQIEVDKIEANFVCPDVNTEYTEETLIIVEVEEL